MFYNTNISQLEGEEFLNEGQFNYWIFSYGGCGTNYLRKIFNIFKIKNRSIINRNTCNLIKSVHLHYPPHIKNNNFLAVYIFGDPYLSLYSIFRRKLYKTINVLAGKKIYNKKKKVNYRKFIKELSSDTLRLKSQFMNWFNSDVHYPILFINYSKLDKSLLNTIGDMLKKDFKIEMNMEEIDNLEKRKSTLNDISKDDLRNLNKVYGIFREYLDELPDYWIKYPKKKNINIEN